MVIRSNENPPRDTRRIHSVLSVVVRAACGLLVLLLFSLSTSSGARVLHFPITVGPVLSLGLIMATVLVFLLLRWLSSPDQKPRVFGKTRGRIGVLSYFLGWLAVSAMLEIHSLTLRNSALDVLLGVLGLTLIFIGIPVLSNNTEPARLAALWTSPCPPLDEREQRLRDRTLALACRIFIIATWFAAASMFWVDDRHLLTSNSGSTQLHFSILAYLCVTGIVLPRAILVWNEEGPSTSED